MPSPHPPRRLAILPQQINWNKYLVSLLDDPLSDNEEIIVNVPTFFAKVDKLLMETDSKLVVYLLWSVMIEHSFTVD